MHASSLNTMREVLGRRLDPSEPLAVLDVGSQLVNRGYRHTYRELMAPAWSYTGTDLAAGENVDVVMPGPYTLSFVGAVFDVVLSGQCLEHVERPWRLVPEMARVLRPGGWLILTAPWRWELHRCPLDCWRILPDGMRVLFEEARVEIVETFLVQKNDCWGIGRKPHGQT